MNIKNITRKKNKYKLFEEYGVHDLTNVNYDKIISIISNDIFNVLNNLKHMEQLDYSCSIYQNNTIYYSNILEYKNLDIDWLSNLNVYIGLGHFLEHNNLYVINKPEFCILGDSGKYVINYINNSVTYEKEKITIIQEFKNNKNQYKNTYIYNKNKLMLGSLLILIPIEFLNMFSKNKLHSIIKHELGHLFDLYKQNTTLNNLNKDIIYSDIINNLDSLNVYETSLLKNILLVDKCKQKLQIKNFNEKLIIWFIKIYSELLNESELHQYLINFKYDLDNTDVQINLFDNDIEREKYLCQISDIYNERYQVLQVLKMFIKYINNNVKDKFVQKYINKTKLEKIYNKSFKPYNTNSFDMFITLLINRIRNIFIKNAQMIYFNKLNNITQYKNIFH